MKALYTFILLVFISISAYSQKSGCKITETVDDFNGSRKIESEDNKLLDKMYVATFLFKEHMPAWSIFVSFTKTDSTRMLLKHFCENNYMVSGIESLDIKFTDNTVLSLKNPQYGEFISTLKQGANQQTLFTIDIGSIEQLATKTIKAARVRFTNFSNDPEVQKDVSESRAAKIKKDAACFLTAIR